MGLRPQRPERCASANFATPAICGPVRLCPVTKRVSYNSSAVAVASNTLFGAGSASSARRAFCITVMIL